MSKANSDLDPICENEHEFVTGEQLGFNEGGVLFRARVCRRCGIVRRHDGRNSECKGDVRVELRETTSGGNR